MMMRTPSFIILLLLTLVLSCATETQYSQNGVGGTGNIALGDDDESGIGGTGKPVSNSGVGGTGKQVASGLGGTGKQDGMGGTGHQGLGGTVQIAKTSGLGGTGIIGEVTGFGSIFVNGIEVEIGDDSEIRSNNKITHSNKPGIGNIVEILAHRVGDETHAKKINIRYEVVGPVSSVNVKQKRFTIIGQSIVLDNPKYHLPKAGEMIAVSGLRDQHGIIHATRISLTKSKSVWLIDRITNNRSNTLKMGRSSIKTEHASYYHIGDIIRVQASYRNGQLHADQIFSNNAFGKQVSHMVLQGFTSKGNRNNYRIGNIQFSTRSAKVRTELNKNRGRWTRLEVSRNSVGLWEVEQFIDNSTLMRGNLTQHKSSLEIRRMLNQKSNSRSSAHDRFNRSIDDDPISPMLTPRTHHGRGKAGMNQNPADSNKQNPTNMPRPTTDNNPTPDSRKPRNMPSRSGGMM